MKTRRVAVVGSNGQLGSDVYRAFVATGDDTQGLTHADLDLSSRESISQCLRHLRPEVIVNTAAMHHVEKCEEDPHQAFAVNALGVRELALAARDIDSVLIHVSTDYVFDGRKSTPYEEEDAPCPLNVYGNSKLAGEYFVRTITPKHFVVRTSALYGPQPCRAKGGLNFVELMLKLARERGKVRVVADEFVSPTFTPELARQIVVLSESDAYGLVHGTAEGSCNWNEFAREIFSLTGTTVDLQVAGPDEFPAKVPRPKYSVLENAALKKRGLNTFADWKHGLRKYLGVRATAVASSI